MPNNRSVIVCAAIRNGLGHIICGPRHHDSIMNDQIRTSTIGWKNCAQGFVDQFGKFYNRQDALKLARKNEQIVRRCGGDDKQLFSENLY